MYDVRNSKPLIMRPYVADPVMLPYSYTCLSRTLGEVGRVGLASSTFYLLLACTMSWPVTRAKPPYPPLHCKENAFHHSKSNNTVSGFVQPPSVKKHEPSTANAIFLWGQQLWKIYCFTYTLDILFSSFYKQDCCKPIIWEQMNHICATHN